MFRQRHKNHAQICLGLRLLVAGVARRFWFAHADDRQEHEADALLYAIERLDRFKSARGRDAFSYYSSLVYNRFLRQLRNAKRQQGRARLFSDVEAAEGVDRSCGSVPMVLLSATPYARAI